MKNRINPLGLGLCLVLFVLLTGWMATRLRAADESAPGSKPAWQYQTFDLPLVDIDRRLNELGNTGLEIVSVSRYTDANGVAMGLVTAKGPRSAAQANAAPSPAALKSTCLYNLRQVDAAIQQFALEHKKAPTDPVTLEDLKPYLKIAPICPAGGTSPEDSYRVSNCQTPPTCIAPQGGTANGHTLQ